MQLVSIMLACAAPYMLAALTAVVIQRINVLPVAPPAAAIKQNTAGRISGQQRRALVVYAAPELVFSCTALVIALLWEPRMGFNGLALRWGLAGMALVRLGISLPTWRDLIDGRVLRLSGPLRKIQFRQRYALATEDGPLVVLPVDRTLFAAHAAGDYADIYYTPHSKRVVAVRAPMTPVPPPTLAPSVLAS